MTRKKDPKRSPRKPQFEVGERVLCFRGPLLYEAECVKVSVKYRKVKYLVHYPGGNEKGTLRTQLSENLAKMEAREIQKAGEANKAQETGEMNERHKDPKTTEISETSEAPESLKIHVICEVGEAIQVPDKATEAQATPEPEITEVCETRRAHAVCEAYEATEAHEAARALDESTRLHATGETHETTEVCETSKPFASHKGGKGAKACEVAKEATKMHGTCEATKACETRRSRAIRKAREAAEAQEATKVRAAMDTETYEPTKVHATHSACEVTEVRETRMARIIREAREAAAAHEAAAACEAAATCEAAKTCDETTKVCATCQVHATHATCEVTEVRETRMARIIREAREAAAAPEIPETTKVCEAAETSDTFKASESQDSHEAAEAIKTSESHETSEAGEISEVGEASVSCETIETSEARKVSEASKDQVGCKGKTKTKGKGKAKAKTDVGHFLTEDDDDVASQDPLCPTAGWDDEWVPESRLLKYSEINLQKQRELFEASQGQSEKGKMARLASGKKTSEGPQQNPLESSAEVFSASVQANNRNQNIVTETGSDSAGNRDSRSTRSRDGSSSSETPQQPRWRRRALVNSDGEPRRGFMRRTEFKVNIPTELKPWLVKDWNMITKQKKLFRLSAKKNVDSILEDYELYERSCANSEDKIYAVPELVAGIREYFNLTLGTHLLYKFEKPQYATVLANEPGVPMSRIYGAPHLLRLFVKIGDMLSYSFNDSHSTNLLLKCLHDFVNYLAKNSAALFSPNDYELASPEYLQTVAEEPENVCHS